MDKLIAHHIIRLALHPIGMLPPEPIGLFIFFMRRTDLYANSRDIMMPFGDWVGKASFMLGSAYRLPGIL